MKKALTLVTTLLLGTTLAMALNPQPLPPGMKRTQKTTATKQIKTNKTTPSK